MVEPATAEYLLTATTMRRLTTTLCVLVLTAAAAAAAEYQLELRLGGMPLAVLLQGIEHGDEALVARAIEDGADLTSRTSEGYTILHIAAFAGNHRIVSALLGEERVRALIDDGANLLGMTPLMMTQTAPTARVLLEAGADRTLRDAQGRLPEEIVDNPDLRRLLRVEE